MSSKNCLDILSGVVVIICLVLALVVPAFSLFVLWTIGFITLPTPGWIGLHFDPKKFHFGLNACINVRKSLFKDLSTTHV